MVIKMVNSEDKIAEVIKQFPFISGLILEKGANNGTPIREAFYQLEAEGLLVVEPRKGVSVAELKPGDINYYYEIRKVLEGCAARCVSGREIMQLKRLNRRYLWLVQSGRPPPNQGTRPPFR